MGKLGEANVDAEVFPMADLFFPRFGIFPWEFTTSSDEVK